MMSPTEFFRFLFEDFILEHADSLDLSLCEVTDECLLVLARHHVAVEGDKAEGLAHLSRHLEVLEVTEVTLH